MDLLIKNARLVDSNIDFLGDIYIKEGKIEEMGKALDKACEFIDAKGYVLMPSFIDMHCHFREPGFTYKEDIETGSKAAVKGGYTAVNLMANTSPVISTMEDINYVENRGREIGLIDINQTPSITRGLKGEDISELDNLTEKVIFISDDGRGIVRNEVMLKAMEKAKKKGFTILSHVEDESLVPFSTRLSENMMTYRDILLSEYTGCPLHICHVSTKEAMSSIIEAKRKGINVTCEVMPHNLLLTSKENYRVNPPLREKEDIDYLISAIKQGFVDMIATDHAPHSKEDKQNGANGISGIETAFSVSYSTLVKEKNINLSKLSELMSKKPAEMMKLSKGKLQIGYDADLVLLDINKKIKVDVNNFESKGKNSPFDGMEFYGEVLMTIKEGRIVYDNR